MFTQSAVVVNGGNIIQAEVAHIVPVGMSATQSTTPFKNRKRKKKKWEKNTLQRSDIVFTDGKPDDIVIAIMGPNGAGKSTFVNAILGQDKAKVGNHLDSCTTQLQHFVADIPPHFNLLRGRRLIILDTIGFDDTYLSDREVLRRIAGWLAHSYDSQMKIGGVIHLQDISQTRICGTAQKCVSVFGALCGNDALWNVVLTTSRWDIVSGELAEMRENGLRHNLWRDLIAEKASVSRFSNTRESAWDTVNMILDKILNTYHADSLQIQAEIVDLNRLISETEAGQMLRVNLEEILRLQKLTATPQGGNLREEDSTVNKLKEQIGSLKIKPSRRLLMFLGLA